MQALKKTLKRSRSLGWFETHHLSHTRRPGPSEHGRGETLFRDTFRDTRERYAKKNLYFTGPVGHCLIPVSGTRIRWPVAISRYLAPTEARLVRAFLCPLFPTDPRVSDFMVRSFPLRVARIFR